MMGMPESLFVFLTMFPLHLSMVHFRESIPMFHFVLMFHFLFLCKVFLKPELYFVSDLSELCYYFFRSALSHGRVFEAFVYIFSSWKERTGFPGLVTYSYHNIKNLPFEFFYTFGAVRGDIYSNLFHNLYCVRIYSCSFSTGTGHFVPVSIEMSQQSLCHLGTCRVMGTDKENGFFQDITFPVSLLNRSTVLFSLAFLIPNSISPGKVLPPFLFCQVADFSP